MDGAPYGARSLYLTSARSTFILFKNTSKWNVKGTALQLICAYNIMFFFLLNYQLYKLIKWSLNLSFNAFYTISIIIYIYFEIFNIINYANEHALTVKECILEIETGHQCRMIWNIRSMSSTCPKFLSPYYHVPFQIAFFLATYGTPEKKIVTVALISFSTSDNSNL